MNDGKMDNDKDRIEQYVFTAEHDMRDIFGVYSVGTGMRYLRDRAGGVLPDNEENRRRFIANGYCCIRQLSGNLRDELKRTGAAVSAFGSASDNNVYAARGNVVPDVNLPLWVSFLPWLVQFKFRECREVGIGRNFDFVDFLTKKGIIPGDVAETDRELLASANFMRVYELLARGGIVFRVVTFFVAPVDETAGGIVAADVGCQRALMDFYRSWEDESRTRLCNYRIFVLASPRGWSDPVPTMSHDHIQCLCTPLAAKTPGAPPVASWDVVHPDLGGLDIAFRNLIYGFYPESAAELCARVKGYIDGLDGCGYGHITSAKVAADMHLDTELVERCFDSLQDGGGYVNYVADSAKAIKKAIPGIRSGRLIRFAPTGDAKYIKILRTLLVTLAGVALLCTKQYLMHKLAVTGGLIICSVVSYLWTCLERVFARKFNK